MKKAVALGIALCLSMTGCTMGKDHSGGQSGTSADALAVQVAKEQAAYYRQLAEDFQEELIAARAEYYEKYTQYEARITALEQQIKEQASADKEESSDIDADAPPEQAQPFRFRLENGSATLVSYDGEDKNVHIPSFYEGAPVTAIADRAFENCIKLESVSVPEGVVTVGWFAFSGCVRLSSVTLPASVRSISYGAFLNCNSNMTITCPKDSYADTYAGSYGIGVKR